MVTFRLSLPLSHLSPVLQTDVRPSGALGLAHLQEQNEQDRPQHNANKRRERKGRGLFVTTFSRQEIVRPSRCQPHV